MAPRRVFYGGIIVGAGVLVTSMGLGARLFMGIGSLFWGALSDRIGTRAVMLCGGVPYFGERIMGTAYGVVLLVSTRSGSARARSR